MTSPVAYLQEVVTELKKVSWPSVKRTREMTLLVIVVTLLVGVYIGSLDYLFSQLMAVLLN